MPTDIQQTALRKLRMLNNAQNINDLRIPPANRLEKLTGDRDEPLHIHVERDDKIAKFWLDPVRLQNS